MVKGFRFDWMILCDSHGNGRLVMVISFEEYDDIYNLVQLLLSRKNGL